MQISDIAWFIIITLALTFPIIFIKQYNSSKNYLYLIAAIVLYVILVLGYTELLSRYSIYHMTPVWLIATILAVLAGIVIFSEKIKPINIIGFILALVAIFLITK